jgi:hypothetical protein
MNLNFYFIRSYEIEKISDFLNSKYIKSKEIFKKMTEHIPNHRPNCKEVYEEKCLWALDKKEFKIDNELGLILKSKFEDKDFSIYSIIISKLDFRNIYIDFEVD